MKRVLLIIGQILGYLSIATGMAMTILILIALAKFWVDMIIKMIVWVDMIIKIIGNIVTFMFLIWILFGCILIYIFELIGKDIRDTK